MKPIANNKKSVLGITVLFLCLPVFASSTVPAKRQAELIHLLKHDCGSCHGMTLQGGLGPALTPQALAGKTPAFLRQTVLDGRKGTAMPPWRGLLSEPEVAWLVGQLIRGETDEH
jgi:cytochrome c55X